ncbi:B12-binding domain-containing radical SAM protein [Pedosphaera parvula]|uniref:Radical SAM domain protein n=1 Tax=Pedosphaera parvula (strain Ellin514) TaxID=320771 RepID=B9XN85_PEDPL|nr:B12-binding domain-containing radical SAM protein [Pedosphaera parvula]EEF58747.1 Radical SAM domain protein [Pedosphaera parvula Ellin514]
MADIVLATLNAKYIHAAFGLRYLMANLGELQSRAALLEFDINQRPIEIVEALLAENPKIIGLGVYIWNVVPTTEVVSALKRIRPDITIVLGGPEVSFEVDRQQIINQADFVITGEADLKFAELCRTLISGGKPAGKIIPAELPALEQLALPYHLYNERDVAHRIIYVEASRGCPFTCEFCLSSLDVPVRQFPLPVLLQNLEELLSRGVQQFKFVDRTFNLNLNTSKALLQFFLDRFRPGLFVHFEMIPDRLPEALREVIAKFPPGALQFEVGIQTFNPEVSKLISRRQDYERLADNFRFLREHTGVHIHADLIVGLPGETVESFGEGFDRLVALKPQEIQVGILKRLRGTPIVRHDAEWSMTYGEHPPYEILQTKLIDFAAMQKMRRFARFWDLIGNSGNFIATTPLIWWEGSPFKEFMRLCDWIYEHLGRKHSIPLADLGEQIFSFLTEQKALPASTVSEALLADYQRGGRSDIPIFLRTHFPETSPSRRDRLRSLAPKRQGRHLQQTN